MLFTRVLLICLVFILIVSGNTSNVIAQGIEPTDPLTGDSSMSVADSVYQEVEKEDPLGRAAAVTEFVIYPNESYIFTNTSTISKTISSNASSSKGIVFDYVTYKSDGTIYGDDMDSTVSVLVQAGGHTVITVTSNPLTVKVPQEFQYTSTTDPALHKVTLSQGESYWFTNAGPLSRGILSNSSSNTTDARRYDYAVYKPDGSHYSSDFNSVTKPSVPVDGEIIITGTSSNPVTVAVPNETFSGERSDEPAYDRVMLYKGQSYRFTNISTGSKAIESDGSSSDKFDYVVYLQDGTESSRGNDTYTEPTVAAGRYVVITQKTDKPVSFGAPYRLFDGGYADGVAISKITIQPSQSYVFRNNGSLSNPIKNNANTLKVYFDYVTYNSDDTYHADGFTTSSDPILPAKSYAIVTNISEVPIVFDYTDDFSVDPSNEPAFHRITLQKGQSAEFRNISPKMKYIDSDASQTNGRRFDYVTYYGDGTEKSRGVNTSTEPGVYPDERTVVTTTTDAPVTFGAVYRLFSMSSESGGAIKRITLQSNESLKFHNNGSLVNPLVNNANSIKTAFDYAIYKEDGTHYADGFNSDADPYIPSHGIAIVTNPSSNPIVFDYTDDFSVETSSETAFLRVSVPKGQSYEFTNISKKDKSLESDASIAEGKLFDYINYTDYGYVGRGTNTDNEPTVDAGMNAIVTTVTDNPVTFGAVNRMFTVKPVQTVDDTLIVRNGESYVFHNRTAQERMINVKNADAELNYDFVSYHSDGKWNKSGRNYNTANLSVPAGGKLIFTLITSPSVTITHSKDILAEPSKHPAYNRVTLSKANSYQFKNIDSVDNTIGIESTLTGGSILFDYVLTDSQGAVISEEKNSQSGFVYVPKNHTLTITSLSDVPTLFAGIYTSFEVKAVEVPKYEITIKKGESYTFLNSGTTSQGLRHNGSVNLRFFDFATYDNSNKAKGAGMNYMSEPISVESNGSVTVTVTSDSSVTFNYDPNLKPMPSQQPALIKQTVPLNKKIEFHNISDFDGGLITNASLQANKYYDYSIYKANGSTLQEGTKAEGGFTIPAKGRIVVKPTSADAVTFGAPYRNFIIKEVTEIKFQEVVVNKVTPLMYEAGKKGYLRFVAASDGTYRFATKEYSGTLIESVISLFNDPELTDMLVTTNGKKKEYGIDYSVIDVKLKAGQVVYIVLSEKDNKLLNIDFVTAVMNLRQGTQYEYRSNNQLQKVILYTGDAIIYEYDSNGNVIKKTKNVFGF